MGRPKKEKSYSPTVTETAVAVGIPSSDQKRPIKTCFYCEEEMTEDYKMYGLDRPFYINLFLHLKCIALIKEEMTLDEYILANMDKVEEFFYKANSYVSKQKSKLLTKDKK